VTKKIVMISSIEEVAQVLTNAGYKVEVVEMDEMAIEPLPPLPDVTIRPEPEPCGPKRNRNLSRWRQ